MDFHAGLLIDDCEPLIDRLRKAAVPHFLALHFKTFVAVFFTDSDGSVFDPLHNVTKATHNPNNAANSNKGSQPSHCMESWLAQLGAPPGGGDRCRLDKISFNFGIHDCNR